MKLKLPLIAAFVALLSLTACGGGGGDSASSIYVASPATLVKTDTVLGTGAEATTGKTLTVKYTGWLYDDRVAGHKGTQFESNTFSFVLGGNVIAGWNQGILGMKAGGKRTLEIPASLAYGAQANGPIPANAGLVFDVELISVQ